MTETEKQLHRFIVQLFAVMRENIYYVNNMEKRVKNMYEMQEKYEELVGE